MSIPKEVEELQPLRLTKEEFTYCHKLAEKIERMSANTVQQRKDVLSWLEANNKMNAQIIAVEQSPQDIELHKYIINNKTCYIVFDLTNKAPPNFIPSGVIMEKFD